MKNPSDILNEIETAFYNIPFDNSDYQNKAFVLAAQLTPARAYRALGLRMSAKLRAIDELKYSRQREQVDIDEWQSIIDDPDATVFAKRRAQIDIDQKRSVRNYTDKLLNDAILELDLLYAEFQKFPRYTREQFELEERKHFELSLQSQLESSVHAPGAIGAIDSIKAMNHVTPLNLQIEQVKNEYTLTNSAE
jgi:hypothetical protein